MTQIQVYCSVCRKKFYRSPGRVNEAQKFGWRPYCSLSCQAEVRRKGIQRVCGNPSCKKAILRKLSDINKTAQSFCSHSCAAIITNHGRAKKQALHPCKNLNCNLLITTSRAFCSPQHRVSHRKIPIETYKTILKKRIRSFYKKQGRIPVKREMAGIYKTAVLLFGTWNNAVVAAGLRPNPVRFAEHHIAKDGHRCYSVAEKLIDDWFSGHNISHERNTPYPDMKHTADFRVNSTLIEFFGLTGELAEYDRHIRIKEQLAKRHGLLLFKLYPKDIYPVKKLDALLDSTFSQKQS